MVLSFSFTQVKAMEKSWVVAEPPAKRMLLSNSGGVSWFNQTPQGSGYVPRSFYAAREEDDLFKMPGEFEEKKEGMKSAAKAAILSFLLPGAGELYGGANTKGKIFIFSEASVWAGYFGLKTYGNWLEDDYKTYAASHAKVDLTGKPDGFFDQLGFYDSRDMYNQFALLYHRGEVQAYPVDDFWNWEWQSKDSRLYYRDLKNRSKDASRRALYMVGLSLVNRIISVVDAMKTVRTYNNKKSFELSHIRFDLKANPLSRNPRFMLYVSRSW
jgi:hypothetical protein